MRQIKTFYDPHPGLLGALIPIPEPVRKAANELDGKKMSIGTAVAYIQATTNGVVSVSREHDFIMLTIQEDKFTHAFRVIRFK